MDQKLKNTENWVVCQIGAREHYAIPRSLHRAHARVSLVTDFWSAGRKKGLPSRLAQRFHPDLPNSNVRAFNWSYLYFSAQAKIRRIQGWDLIVARNQWFAARASQYIAHRCEINEPPDVVFAYSYAAKEILEVSKRYGIATVLGQIDPGPFENRLVASLYQSNGEDFLDEPPESYWEQWHQECDLSDRIVVNSNWSKNALLEEGVDESKIAVVPLAYEASREQGPPCKQYPVRFSNEHPLTVLFLGQVNRRKGASELLDAIICMEHEPVRWLIVGPVDPQLRKARVFRNAEFVGAVSRGDAERYYSEADLFILPTHSDGFAMTQLEAASHGLPIIASRFCGDVVKDGRNGILMKEVSVTEVVRCVRAALNDVPLLSEMARCQARTSFLGTRELAAALVEAVSPGVLQGSEKR